MAGNVGFSINAETSLRTDAFLFGESQSRVVVSVSGEQQAAFEAAIQASGVAFSHLGQVTASDFVINDTVLMTVADAKAAYDNALGNIMS